MAIMFAFRSLAPTCPALAPDRSRCSSPEQRRSLQRDLWWALVADRVEVHTVPGAHMMSITEHGTEVVEQLWACLAGRPRATPAP